MMAPASEGEHERYFAPEGDGAVRKGGGGIEVHICSEALSRNRTQDMRIELAIHM